MTAEDRVSEHLKSDLAALLAQASNQYQLLREISSILNTVTSTLTAANQISAHERESLLARLESINSEITQERRELGALLSKVERSIESLEREFGESARDREETAEHILEIQRHAEEISQQVKAISPSVSETLRHARKMVDRDPDTGAEASKSDKVWVALGAAFWTAVTTAVVLYLISHLVPWVRGISLPQPQQTISSPAGK